MSGYRNNNREKLRDLLGDLKDATLKPLLACAKAAHPKIEEYIHSEVGVKMQYLDSQITEAILVDITKQGIPCLPIHDSYIVPAKYEEHLHNAMMVE